MVEPVEPSAPQTKDPLAGHAALVVALRRHFAATLPGEAVVQIDTHISTLLLVGEHAYKLKKPLALGFLDFSSLAARRQACEAELRLNRRTAPRIYLALRPVLGPVDKARLGPAVGPADAWGGNNGGVNSGINGDISGDVSNDIGGENSTDSQPIIDWAVQMRRFNPAMGLDALARRGELGSAHIDALAEVLACFHLGLPPAPPGFGDPAVALRWARDTLRDLPASMSDAAGKRRMAALSAWTEARWLALKPLMQTRVQDGWVRECHGDLHLANIVWLDGEPLPFDALEFDATLRCIDVINDLAFTVMDLQAHGLPALAWRLASRWCERTGDHAGLALLPWHAVQRALVRAKVALIAAHEHAQTNDSGAAHALQEQAERYLRAAEHWAARRRPQLVVVWGLSGTGKSTVAEVLAETLGAPRIRSDVERKRLFGLGAEHRPADPATLYNADATTRTYARLEELAGRLLGAGLSVVIDAACLKRAERLALRDIARSHGAAWHALQCVAPTELLRRRIAARLATGHDASDATLAVLEMQLGAIEAADDDEADGAETLDTDLSLDALRQACVDRATGWARAAGEPSR